MDGDEGWAVRSGWMDERWIEEWMMNRGVDELDR